MYEYRVREIIRVIDGDTIDVSLSVGFGWTGSLRIRLKDIDTPEIYGPNADSERGAAALQFTTEWLQRAIEHKLVVRTYKGSANTVGIGDGAFGRWLGAFIDENGESLADALRAAGYEK